MYKKTITYTNLFDEEVKETFYFNLTESELIKYQMSSQQGLDADLQGIIDAVDKKSIIDTIEKIILMSYGVKSEDGRRFIKSEQISEEFKQTPAYDILFMEIATDDEKAAEFINGIIPSKLSDQVQKMLAEQNAKTDN